MEKKRVQPNWQEAHRILRLRAQRRNSGGSTRNALDRCRRTITTDDTSRVRKGTRDTKYIGSVIERQLAGFIENARSSRMSTGQILQRLKSATPRVHHFGNLGLAVLQRYERELDSEGRIDFSEMLHRAADIVEKGASSFPKFDHVLVDEFQDTSTAMARLVNALVRTNHSHLFAVVDDWQAIYGFAGGDVDHVVNFESHFGPASRTMLNTNYRSPATIVEAGATLNRS